MPHSRHRFSTAQVLEKLRFYPVVALQGARQTGKSYLSRELLQQHLPESRYLTFDQDSARVLAGRDIESFLQRHADARPLILDEAQKVPKVFDAIKFVVDQKRVPGAFLLLGSTEFSRIMGILESLTGRMGRVRIHPLTLAECHSLPLAAQLATRKPHPFFLEKAPRLPKAAVLKHLETGGLPGIFSVRSADERRALLQDPDPVDTLSIYRTHQGRRVGFIRELSGGELALVRLFDHPPSKKTDFFALEGAQKAIQTKVGKKTKVRLIALSPTLHAPNPKSVELLPWEAMG